MEEFRLIKLFISEHDRYDGEPLYKAVVDYCLKQGIAGATVVRGVYGYGGHRQIHSGNTIVLAEELPMLVQICDTEKKINNLIPTLKNMMSGGLLTVERVEAYIAE